MALRPCRQIVRIEVGEVDVAFFVPDCRAQFLIDCRNGDRALAELGAVRIRCCTDRCCARRNRGDHADVADRCNARVARRPCDRAVGSRQRRDLCGQVRRVASVKVKGVRRDRNGHDAVRIDLIADRGLDIQINAVGRCVQAERIVVVPQITTVDGKPVIRAIPGPVSAAGILGNRQRVRTAAAEIPTVVVERIGSACAAGSCRPNALRVGVAALNIGLTVGIRSTRIDRCSKRACCCSCLRRIQRIVQTVTGTCRIAAHDQVIFTRRDGIRQNIDRLFNVGVVVDLDRSCRFVACIVACERRNIALRVRDRVGCVERNRIGIGARGNFRIRHGAVQRQNADICERAIVACGDGKRIAVQRRARNFRRGVVDREVKAHKRALAELSARQHRVERRSGQEARARTGQIGAVLHRVVFGDRIEADANLVAFLDAVELVQRLVDRIQLRRGILPCGIVCMIPCAEHFGAGHVRRDDPRHIAVLIQLGDRKARARRRTNQVIGDIVDLRVAADRKTFFGEFILHHVRVAGELCQRALGGDAHVVRGRRIRAGVVQLLVAVQILGVGVGIEHLGIGPASEVADDRDGMLMAQIFVLSRDRDAADVGVTFDVAAAFSRFIDRLLRIGQVDVYRDLCLVVRADYVSLGTCARFPVEKQICVVRGDHFVAVQICDVEVVVGIVHFELAADEIEDRLCVEIVGHAVQIDVVLFRRRFAVPLIGDAACRKQLRLVGKGVAVVDSLCEQIRAELELERLIGNVVNGELVCIRTGSFRIVAEFDLDLAVRCRAGIRRKVRIVHHDDGLRFDRLADLNKTCALLEDRNVCVAVDHRRCGTHQQALRNRAEVVCVHQVFVRRRLLLEVLHQDRRKTGDVRRRHGRTGEYRVRGAAAAGVRIGRTEDGIDLTARRRDFRFHDERARNAPGTELRHFGVFTRGDHGDRLRGDLYAAGVIVDAADGAGGAVLLDRFGILQKDRNERERTGEILQRHVDHALNIVRNDQCLRVVALQVVSFVNERQLAAVDDDDLAGQRNRAVDRGIVRRFALGVNVDVIPGAADRRHLGVGVCHAIAALGIFRIEDRLVSVEHQRRAFGQRILRCRNAHAVDVRAGRTAGVEERVFRIQLVRRMIVVRIGVARRDRNDHVIVRRVADKRIQDGLIIGIIGPAGRRGTERKVRCIRAEHDRVFQSRKIVGIVCAAACAEDLHDEDLGVRRHADRIDVRRRVFPGRTVLDIAVRRRDTCNVGTVVALRVVVSDVGVVIVDVVVRVRDLGADALRIACVQTGRRNARHQFDRLALCADLFDRVIERVLVHALVRRVKTGVDDRDLAACAGIAELIPCILRADHVFTGVRRVRIHRNGLGRFIQCFQLDGSDTVHAADRGDVLIRDLDGDRVCKQRQVPFHGEFVTDFGLDLRLHGLLLLSELVPIRGRTAVVRNVLCIIAHVDRGLAVQEDGGADDLVEVYDLELCRIETVVLFFVYLAQLMDVQFRGIHLLHLERNALGRGFGFRLVSRAFGDCARDARRDRHREQHENRHQHGKKSLHFRHPSFASPFFILTFRVRSDGSGICFPIKSYMIYCQQ